MKLHVLASLLGLALLAIVGCASAPKQQPLTDAAAKAAVYPPIDGYQERVKRAMRYTLKDPDSAIYDSWTIYRAYVATDPVVFGYMINVRVNAKNSYGGYTGFQSFRWWIGPNQIAVPVETAPARLFLVDIVDIVAAR